MEEQPEIVEATLQGHIQSVNYAKENTEDTLKTINDALYNLTQQRLPESVLESAWQRLVVTTDTYPDALQAWADASYQLKFIEEEPDLTGFVDTSKLDELVK